MRIAPSAVAFGLALALAACGSAPEQPVEQIVVRQPGQEAAPPAAAGARDRSPLAANAAGQAAFAACSGCHAIAADAAPGVGPNLAGVFGRKAGSLDGFGYSAAMRGSGIAWNEGELDAFLANPSGRVPGTSMTAGAVSDAGQRKAIIAYLAGISR